MKDFASKISRASKIHHDGDGESRPLNRAVLAQGSEVIRPFFETLEKLRADIEAKSKSGDPAMARKLLSLIRKIDNFEASVTLIGQVKAGKTALSNVLSGNIGLLPSDVNPWTSVVTSIHMNANSAPVRSRAAFKFFDGSEWDAMIKGGGRLGELAGRAGADDDMEKLRRQIQEMRATARQRLSGKFEALLGKTHKYGYVDRELMERYVCLGDPDEIELNPQAQQGRFSDLVKSADIWIDVPEIGGSLLLRDTPGVNDTFMVREQITIQALRRSKVCVVVLSAHEALNTTDLALVRLISNYENRQVVLFVNRIDELERPSEQVPEILNSIRKTLKSYRSLSGVEVVFGSARWAEMALSGDYSGMDEDAVASLNDWSTSAGVELGNELAATVWELSGVPSLMRAVYHRIVEESGRRHFDSIRVELQNIASEIAAKDALGRSGKAAAKLAEIEVPALRTELDQISKAFREKLDKKLKSLHDGLTPVLQQVQADYVERARNTLLDHLRENSGDETWTFNSAGLRLVLRTDYDRFAADVKTEVKDVFDNMTECLTAVYVDRLGIDIEDFSIAPPVVPKVPPPVGLGKTIAVDLGTNWWSRWWQRRRGLKTQAEDFSTLLDAEIGSIITDLQSQLGEVYDDMRSVLSQFLTEQSKTILDLVRSASVLTSRGSEASTAAAEDFNAMLNSALGLMDQSEGSKVREAVGESQ